MCAAKMTGPSGRGKGNSLLGTACSKRGWREESKDRIKTNPVITERATWTDGLGSHALSSFFSIPLKFAYIYIYIYIYFFFLSSILHYADLLNCYIYSLYIDTSQLMLGLGIWPTFSTNYWYFSRFFSPPPPLVFLKSKLRFLSKPVCVTITLCSA